MTKEDTKAFITEAVQAGLQAGRAQASSMARDAFKATERRLYALPVLEKKVKGDIEKLYELKTSGPHNRSKDMVRFSRTGYRVDPDEMLAAVIQDLEATIAAAEYEIETVREAMAPFSGDLYYPTVTGRYLYRYEDEDIADELGCGTTQVWKQRTRIVKDIAVMLYGVGAV